MPIYLFKDKNTKKEWKEFMGISEADRYLADNPHIERLVHGAPRIVTSVGTVKVPNAWKDHLKEMKKKAGKTSTIDTY